MQFAGSAQNGITGFSVRFAPQPVYSIGACVALNTPISNETLGEDNDRIWTIEKDSARVKLLCNGVVIVDIEIKTSDSCGNLWSRDFAGMRFMDRSYNGQTKDTASDFFRQYTAGESLRTLNKT